MDETLRFFRTYELWIYGLLFVGAVVYFRRLLLAWNDLRAAIFGLEREAAQTRLNHATLVLSLLIVIALTEFVVVTFVVPLRPEALPLPTPTLDLLASPTVTLPVETPLPEGATTLSKTALPPPLAALEGGGGCVPGEIELLSPRPGDQLRGEVDIIGTADIANFGFYKIEIAQQNDTQWRTIQAGREPVREGILVEGWDTTTLPIGDYVLRLVLTDTSGESLPDCRILVRISAP